MDIIYTIETEIVNSIVRTINEFHKYPDVFLTEEDLRCHIFHELLKEKNISKIMLTEDNNFSISLHSEARWYGQKKEFKIRSDIIILDVSSLHTMRDGMQKLPSKGYGFGRAFAVIETKLRRPNGHHDNQWYPEIQKDIDKLLDIQHVQNNDVKLFLIIFDKKHINKIKKISNPYVHIYYENRFLNIGQECHNILTSG